jgi:serine/threonine protein kinase
MLAGYPPFYDEDQRKLFKKIKEGRYYFHEEYWSHISRDVIDLITKMLTVNQQERWTAKQLLEHPWVTANSDVLKNKSLDSSVSAMKKYNIRRKFKAAADAVIISNRIGKMIFRLMSIDPNALKESENVKSEEIAHDDVADFLKKELEVVPEVVPEAGPDINA